MRSITRKRNRGVGIRWYVFNPAHKAERTCPPKIWWHYKINTPDWCNEAHIVWLNVQEIHGYEPFFSFFFSIDLFPFSFFKFVHDALFPTDIFIYIHSYIHFVPLWWFLWRQLWSLSCPVSVRLYFPLLDTVYWHHCWVNGMTVSKNNLQLCTPAQHISLWFVC